MDEIKPQFVLTVTGPKESGKTTWLRELIQDHLLDMFPKIIVMSPTLDLSGDFDFLREQEKSEFFLSEDPSEYDEQMQEIINTQRFLIERDKADNVLIVLDDCATESICKQNSILDKFCIRHRHYLISLIIVGHKFRGNCGLPTGLRSQINSNIIFNPSSMSELELLLKEAVLSDHLKEAKKRAVEVFSSKFNYIVFTPSNVYFKRLMINYEEPLLSGGRTKEEESHSEESLLQRQKNKKRKKKRRRIKQEPQE